MHLQVCTFERKDMTNLADALLDSGVVRGLGALQGPSEQGKAKQRLWGFEASADLMHLV